MLVVLFVFVDSFVDSSVDSFVDSSVDSFVDSFVVKPEEIAYIFDFHCFLNDSNYSFLLYNPPHSGVSTSIFQSKDRTSHTQIQIIEYCFK